MQEETEGAFDIQSMNQITLTGWRLQEASGIVQIWKRTHTHMHIHNLT